MTTEPLYGVIYGVAMSEDCKRAEFVRVTDETELGCLRGSKYLHAHVGETFKKVREDLDDGATVLFSGTGCQINGVKNYLSDGKYETRNSSALWMKIEMQWICGYRCARIKLY